MSTSVELERLRAEATRRGSGAFLLTVSSGSRPHVVAVAVGWDGDGALAMATGRSTAANAAERPDVTLLWPPDEPGGYSLIVDGRADVEARPDGGRVTVRPTRAVLHRPGVPVGGTDPAARDAEACTSDCVPLLRTT